MRLDDDIETAGPDETVCSGERKAKLIHHFGNTDCGRSGYTNSAVDKSGNTSLSSFSC